MKKLVVCMLLLSFAFILGCGGLFKGDKGDTGRAGTSLIKTYSGTITSNGSYSLDVPEIEGYLGTRFVLAYWSYSTSPNIWKPMTDGWLDDTTALARILSVSWTYGKVYLNYMTAGDNYLIQIYQNESTS